MYDLVVLTWRFTATSPCSKGKNVNTAFRKKMPLQCKHAFTGWTATQTDKTVGFQEFLPWGLL
jgi:hypothetical protein